MKHFIKKCERCATVIAQCRCPDPNKTVEYGMCDKCSMTPPPTTPKRIEKLELGEFRSMLFPDMESLSVYNKNLQPYMCIMLLVDKINELIDRLSTIEEERK